MKISYDKLGRDGRVTTKSVVHLICDQCSTKFTRINQSQIKMESSPLYDKDYCPKCWRKILNNRSAYKERMSESISAKYENPDWADMQRLSKAGINRGDKNGMKQPEARQRVSKARVEYFSNPENRQAVADAVSKAWKEGKYDGASVGRCKWFTLEHPNGTSIKVQGTWERAYAEYLIREEIRFVAHRGRIPYIIDGNERSYYPDFYLIDEDMYIDIKNRYHFKSQKKKFELLREQHPDITIRIIFGDELRQRRILND